MELSYKAIYFLIEAIDFHQQHMRQELQKPGRSEDEMSDLLNDYHFLEAIKYDLQLHLRQQEGSGSEAQ
ncbi:MAG: hypothetical protein HYV63_19605 [Candidatus Schekmanbacteria bacterium]|nr:hypothetical protein [Candidatus Schekmanbacteria bacterium]